MWADSACVKWAPQSNHGNSIMKIGLRASENKFLNQIYFRTSPDCYDSQDDDQTTIIPRSVSSHNPSYKCVYEGDVELFMIYMHVNDIKDGCF